MIWLLSIPAVVVWLAIGVYVLRKWDRGMIAMLHHDIPWLGLTAFIVALVFWPLGPYSMWLVVPLAKGSEWLYNNGRYRWPFSWYYVIKTNHQRLKVPTAVPSTVGGQHRYDLDVSSMYPYVAKTPEAEERFDRIQPKVPE